LLQSIDLAAVAPNVSVESDRWIFKHFTTGLRDPKYSMGAGGLVSFYAYRITAYILSFLNDFAKIFSIAFLNQSSAASFLMTDREFLPN
jgi:hypothetical protein